ncbi:MAG: hypothetical protein ACRD0K_26870 [Egibacteraceae bacterium]
MYLIQDALDRARFPLNDVDGDRYTDVVLLPIARGGLEGVFRKRPDLFFGQYDALDFSALAVTDPFPLEPYYLQVLADYITARAEGVDDESMSSGRAQTYYTLFVAG